MICAIELDHQAGARVIKVGSPEEPALSVTKLGLNLRLRHVVTVQQPPKAGLHRRLRRFGELNQEPQSARAWQCDGLVRVSRQLGPVRQRESERHVHKNEGLDTGSLNTDVSEGAL